MSVFLSFRCVKVVQCFKIMGVECVGYEKNISHNGWRQNNRVECYNENNDLGSGSSSHPGHWKYWTGSSKKLELRSDSYALMGEDMKVQRSKAGWSWDNSCCELILLALNSIRQPACKIKVKHTCVLPFAHPQDKQPVMSSHHCRKRIYPQQKSTVGYSSFNDSGWSFKIGQETLENSRLHLQNCDTGHFCTAKRAGWILVKHASLEAIAVIVQYSFQYCSRLIWVSTVACPCLLTGEKMLQPSARQYCASSLFTGQALTLSV